MVGVGAVVETSRGEIVIEKVDVIVVIVILMTGRRDARKTELLASRMIARMVGAVVIIRRVAEVDVAMIEDTVMTEDLAIMIETESVRTRTSEWTFMT